MSAIAEKNGTRLRFVIEAQPRLRSRSESTAYDALQAMPGIIARDLSGIPSVNVVSTSIVTMRDTRDVTRAQNKFYADMAVTGYRTAFATELSPLVKGDIEQILDQSQKTFGDHRMQGQMLSAVVADIMGHAG